jgi:hypothetical protein
MVGLILVVTAEAKLRNVGSQGTRVIRAVRIVACRAVTLQNRAMDGLRTRRYRVGMTGNAQRIGRKFQQAVVLGLMCAVAECAKCGLNRSMKVLMFRQVSVAVYAVLTGICRKSKSMLARLDGDVTFGAKLLITPNIMG